MKYLPRSAVQSFHWQSDNWLMRRCLQSTLTVTSSQRQQDVDLDRCASVIQAAVRRFLRRRRLARRQRSVVLTQSC